MKILAVASVEKHQYDFIKEQIANQILQPQEVLIMIDTQPAEGINNRRKRIADNQAILESMVNKYDVDLIWQIEGDSVLPPNTLQKLVRHYRKLKNDDFGYISGIQVGRHGLYCIGAWHIAEDRQSFESVDYRKKGLVSIDATGFYCLLAPKGVWMNGIATWNGEMYGPDVNWGLSIRKKKYVDMDLTIGHKIKSGIIKPEDLSTCNVRFYVENDTWKFKQYL